MTILELLQILLAVGTIGTGLISLIRPRAIGGFTGLAAPGPRGITEIRAVVGGTFIGLGVSPLILDTPQAFQIAGYHVSDHRCNSHHGNRTRQLSCAIELHQPDPGDRRGDHTAALKRVRVAGVSEVHPRRLRRTFVRALHSAADEPDPSEQELEPLLL